MEGKGEKVIDGIGWSRGTNPQMIRDHYEVKVPEELLRETRVNVRNKRGH